MSTTKRSGNVQTVLGLIKPESLGITLTHEHMVLDLSYFDDPPEEASERAWVNAEITMGRRAGIIKRTHFNKPNFQMLDSRQTIQELNDYRNAGGNSMVDATSIGIGRDPLALTRISRASGLNIVMGSSYYVPRSWPKDMGDRSEESITEQIVRDITVGVGDTRVCSGIIGEIGNIFPMGEIQAKILKASAQAQVITGAPILIHPGMDLSSPMQILDILTQSGASFDRIIMGHMDLFHDGGPMYKEVLRTGSYVEMDIFGYEDSSWLGPKFSSGNSRWMTDSERLDLLEMMINEGFSKQIVVAHDKCVNYHRMQYGGKGYGHILENIVPRMRKRGFQEDHINDILVENPKRILTFR